MKVLTVRNVHEALPRAMWMLKEFGLRRQSRNGPVLIYPSPVTTVYERPCERVLFWPQRDANPAFHLYESLWMLAGRNDLAPLLRYVKDFGRFSDDGKTLAGAYGYQWRMAHDDDQLQIIAERLQKDPDDRRCVLQMWQAQYNLGANWKDIPCNLIATFQRDIDGKLDLTVFCRSNDIIWGAYGANAVHFSMLLEYMARWIGCNVGVYRQVSVNWHAYEEPFKKIEGLISKANGLYGRSNPVQNPYLSNEVFPLSLPLVDIRLIDEWIRELLMHVDTDFELPRQGNDDEPWLETAYAVLRSHHLWRTLPAPHRFTESLAVLDGTTDWMVAMRQWLERRQAAWEEKRESA